MAEQTDDSADVADPQAAPRAPLPDDGEAPDASAIHELNDRLLRALADAENARKRADRARIEGRDAGVSEVTAGLVPVLDSLDLAIETARRNDQDVSALLDGLEATRRAFSHALAKYGVESIQPEPGDAFDPNVHEAVAACDDDVIDAGRIVSAAQAGYRVGARLIRPARVIIAAAR